MAQRNYLVEGLPGTGKSAVYEELTRRGYWAISTDRAWAYNADVAASKRAPLMTGISVPRQSTSCSS